MILLFFHAALQLLASSLLPLIMLPLFLSTRDSFDPLSMSKFPYQQRFMNFKMPFTLRFSTMA
jgi:hypothetical protein